MRTIETKVYTIDEHPNKEKCYEWIRNNWTDLNEYSVQEVVASIKALSEKIGGTFNYSISQSPDRGEFIRFVGYDVDILSSLKADDLPLTGVWCDMDVINGLKDDEPEQVLDTLHADTEYQYSDDALYELCSANEYEFTEDGTIA